MNEMEQRNIDNISMTQMISLVTAALTDFYARDHMLFRDKDESLSVSERAMAARIGIYLEMHRSIIGSFDDLSIDLEYNRNFNAPKSIYSLFNRQRRNVIPDLLIHKRNSNDDNLLVIEFKKGTPPYSERQNDEEKLRYFTDSHNEYRFRFGMYIELHHWGAYVDIYRNGHKVDGFVYR